MSSQSGQSLLEAIVAVAVVIILVTGIIAGTTSSLRAAAYSRARSEATKLVQEAIEVARSDRDTSWDTFRNYDGTTFCLGNSSTYVGQPTGTCVPNKSITSGGLTISFTRSVEFTYNVLNERMEVKASVSWNEGSNVRTSRAETYFTQWR